MTHTNHDTDWSTSSKGNLWRRKDGIVLIAGKSKSGRYWARRGDEFIPGSFASLAEAKQALENDLVDPHDRLYWDDREYPRQSFEFGSKDES